MSMQREYHSRSQRYDVYIVRTDCLKLPHDRYPSDPPYECGEHGGDDLEEAKECYEAGEELGGLEKRLMRVGEVSEYLGISQSTLFRWIKKGVLRAVKIDRALRIHPRDLAGFIGGRTKYYRA